MDRPEELNTLTVHFENLVGLTERRALFMNTHQLDTSWLQEKLTDLERMGNNLQQKFDEAEEHSFPSLPAVKHQFEEAKKRLQALRELFPQKP